MRSRSATSTTPAPEQDGEHPRAERDRWRRRRRPRRRRCGGGARLGRRRSRARSRFRRARHDHDRRRRAGRRAADGVVLAVREEERRQRTISTKPGTMKASPPTNRPANAGDRACAEDRELRRGGTGEEARRGDRVLELARRSATARARPSSRGAAPCAPADRRRRGSRAVPSASSTPRRSMRGRGLRPSRTAARKCSIVSRTATSSGVTGCVEPLSGQLVRERQRHVVEGDRPRASGAAASIAATTSFMWTGVPGKSYGGGPAWLRAGGGDEPARDVGRVVQLGAAAEGDAVRLAARRRLHRERRAGGQRPGRDRGRRRRRGGCPRSTRPRRPSRRCAVPSLAILKTP